MGRTTRPLRVRTRESIQNIRNGFPKHDLSRHFEEKHHKDPSCLTFYGVDIIKDHWRGGNKKIQVSQNETRWIHRLGSLAPRGLNLDIHLNCFISNFKCFFFDHKSLLFAGLHRVLTLFIHLFLLLTWRFLGHQLMVEVHIHIFASESFVALLMG